MTRFHTLILILYLLFSAENVYGQYIAYANIDSVIKNSKKKGLKDKNKATIYFKECSNLLKDISF